MAKSKIEWSKWYLVREGESFCIRRYRKIDGKTKWERLTKKQYSHFKSEPELQAFLKRLNLRGESELAKAKSAYEFKHAFITQEIKDEFRALLAADIPTQDYVQSLCMWLDRCCLHWFINQLGKPDPVDWKLHEKKWGLALLCKLEGREAEKLKIWDSPVHPETVKKQKQVANRFLAFLHQKLPREVPAIVLDPISKAQMRLYNANYTQGEDYVPGRFITAERCLFRKKPHEVTWHETQSFCHITNIFVPRVNRAIEKAIPLSEEMK